jgi:predicted dehydrogenase
MIKVGIAGARGLSSLIGFNQIPDVTVEALCDLDEAFLNEQARKHQIPKTYRVFDDMLASDIDAVVVATPMHLHVPQTLEALEAGKHVLSEVIAGVTLDELWWLIEAVEKHQQIYMLAENFCYIPENQIVQNMVDAGLFGDVYFGEGDYLHDIRQLAVRPNSRTSTVDKTTWRKYWQLGKRGNFYPTHSLGPVMKWFAPDRIKSVQCVGAGWNHDLGFRADDTTLTLCQMESGKLIKLRLDCISQRPHNMAYYALQGTKGCYEAPRGLGDDHKVWLKDLHPTCEWRALSEYPEYLPARYQQATAEQKAAGHWGADFFIIEDFVHAIKAKSKPAIDVYEACEWTAVAFLSELSVMNHGRAIDMPAFRQNLTHCDKVLRI